MTKLSYKTQLHFQNLVSVSLISCIIQIQVVSNAYDIGEQTHLNERGDISKFQKAPKHVKNFILQNKGLYRSAKATRRQQSSSTQCQQLSDLIHGSCHHNGAIVNKMAEPISAAIEKLPWLLISGIRIRATSVYGHKIART